MHADTIVKPPLKERVSAQLWDPKMLVAITGLIAALGASGGVLDFLLGEQEQNEAVQDSIGEAMLERIHELELRIRELEIRYEFVNGWAGDPSWDEEPEPPPGPTPEARDTLPSHDEYHRIKARAMEQVAVDLDEEFDEE